MFRCFRIGPSVSDVGPAALVLGHLEGLSKLLEDPAIHILLESLRGNTGLSLDRIGAALLRGHEAAHGKQISHNDMLDAASKAARARAEHGTPTEKPKDASTEKPEDTSTKKPEGDKTGEPDEDTEKVSPGSSNDKAVPGGGDIHAEPVVNSSTHRNEHARLSRRMASLPEAENPNMHKLWSGSRQDSCFILPCAALTNSLIYSLLLNIHLLVPNCFVFKSGCMLPNR